MLSRFRDTPVQTLDLPQVLAYLIVNFSATWSKSRHIPILCMHIEIEAMTCTAYEVVFRNIQFKNSQYLSMSNES